MNLEIVYLVGSYDPTHKRRLMQTNDSYEMLIQKLDAFIRKYYINDLIRGTLHSFALLLALFISFSLIEHYVFTSSVSSIQLRKTLFYSFTGISVAALGYWMVRPALQYFRLGKVISHERASQIVGEHFTEVKDKLLNVLQLRQQLSESDNALLAASIRQKSNELTPVPFQAAIDLTKNKRYLRFALPPFFLFVGLILSSNILENSAKRILNNDKEFEREALFRFKVLNESPKVVQYEDYEMEVQVEGDALPSEVFIEVDNYKYKLEKTNNNTFKYKFYKLQKDTDFRLTANGFTSKSYAVDVLEKPNLMSFDVQLDYPNYIGRKDEKLNNVGDLVVPSGTTIDWLFMTQNTDNIEVRFVGDAEKVATTDKGAGVFSVQKRILRDGQYKIYVSNKLLPNADSVTYTLTVMPDMHPNIEVKKHQDTINDKIVYFAGEASDDYGIRALRFHYKHEHEGKIKKEANVDLPAGGKQSAYEYILNVKEFDLKPGDKLSYYFEVLDNDAVSGSKSARTPVMYYEMPTMKEIEKKEEENNSEIKNELDDALKETKELSDQIKKVKEDILQKDKLNWQDRREIEKMLKQQKEVEKKLNEAKQNFEENRKNQEEFQKTDPELEEKQQKLEELFDKVMSDEMKELFEQMEKLLQELDKGKILENLEQMEMKDEELEKEIDRLMELFQKMEVEKNVLDAIQKLDSLAKEQEKLSEQTEKNEKAEENKDNKDPNKDNKDPNNKDGKNEEKPMTQEEIEKKQEELNKEFEELKEQLEKTMEKNEELEQPLKLDEKTLEQMQKEVQENQKNSSQQLQQKQNKNASKSQKNASQQMKEMSKSLQESMQMNQMQQMQQDLRAMRQLLENLVTMSFEQESLIDEVNQTMPNTPIYVKLVQRQYKLKDDFRHIEDSLQALSKRVFQIEAFVTEKVSTIKKTMKDALYQLEDRQKKTAVVQQQYTMTNVNDLALMLSESMEQMQQQMAQQMPGSQVCEKPGEGQDGDGKGGGQGQGKKPGTGGLLDMQRQLNEQLQQMQQQLKDGKLPGDKMSQKFAEMAAKQAAIRKALQDMKRERQQQGKGGQDLQNIIDAMDKIETELVNKRMPHDLNKRIKDIETRLLEADKAERERGFDDKRKAERPDEYQPKMPPALEEYLKQRRGQVELFKTVSPNLKPYYRNLVEDYFRSLK